jgi:hypothetical protein
MTAPARFVLAPLVALAAAFPIAAAMAPQQSSETVFGRISGWTLSASSEPIAGAEVILPCPPLNVQRTTSDASGRFEFRSAEGNCRLMARKDGYVETSFNGDPAAGGYGIKVRGGASHDGIELRLVPGGVVAGTIAGPGGARTDGVRLQLVRRDVINGIVRLVPLSYAPVRDGRYRTAPVAPGDYYVRAFPPPAGTEPVVSGVAPTYFPGTSKVGEATLITIKAGDVREADFSLVAARTFAVSGTVSDASGAPLRDGVVTIDEDGSPAWIRGTGKTDGNGRFTIRGLTDGRYVLHAMRPRTTERPMEIGEVHFDVNGGDVDHLVVRVAAR